MRLAVTLLLASCSLVHSAERFPGQYAQANPGLRQWFGSQQVPTGPSKGMSCCSDADGVKAQDDIRGGKFWATFTIVNPVTKEEIEIPFMQVPDTAVLEGPFPAQVATAIVWWYAEYDDSRVGTIKKNPDGSLRVFIRCMKPSSQV